MDLFLGFVSGGGHQTDSNLARIPPPFLAFGCPSSLDIAGNPRTRMTAELALTRLAAATGSVHRPRRILGRSMHFERERTMRIYVGNLPYSVSDEDLRETFKVFGSLTNAEVVKDKFSGQSKGFGFVDMPNHAEADSAIRALHDQPLKGRKLTVNEARPRPDRPPRQKMYHQPQ